MELIRPNLVNLLKENWALHVDKVGFARTTGVEHAACDICDVTVELECGRVYATSKIDGEWIYFWNIELEVDTQSVDGV